MKKTWIIFLLISFWACQSKKQLQEIDSIVEKSINEKFSSIDDNLWHRLEERFYQGIDEPDWKNKDKNKLLMDFMYNNLVMGFSSNFALNESDKELLNDLNDIGLKKGDDAAHEFLHSTIANKVKSLNYSGNLLKDAPMIASYTIVDPDSVSLSFSLMNLELHKHYKEKDMEREGLYKLIVIFYFSEMINWK